MSDFPALQSEGGSIQVQFSGSTPHPLMINRGAGQTFYALDSDCQHAHCIVPTYHAATGQIRCTCQGSRYAIDGSLLGGPATRGLNTFDMTFDGVDTLAVKVPGLAFSVTNIALQASQPARRLKLTANVLPYSTYQVFLQMTLSAPRQAVPFATTPSSAADTTSAFTSTNPVTLYVDSAPGLSSGFYTVALVASLYGSSLAPVL